MESSTQTTLFNYLSIADLPLDGEEPIENCTQTFIGTPLRFVYVNAQEDVKQSIRTEDDSEENDEDEEDTKSRKRHPENWRQVVRKRNKNRGLEYVKANGEVSAKKQLGPPCTCKMKCYQRIGQEACHKVFNNFWKLGDHSLQNAYIAGCVRIFLPKHFSKRTETSDSPSRRFYTRNFYVNVNGVDTEICKQAFLNLHSISNGRLDRLLKKKQEIGNTGIDARGRHNNKINKIPSEKIREVRRSIDGFRKRAGFTGKRKSKNVEMLPGPLNIRAMYRKYREEMIEKGIEPVCEFRYRKIFHSDFHIDFARSPVPASQNAARPAVQPNAQPVPQSTAAPPPSPPDTMAMAPPQRTDRPIYATLETKEIGAGPTYVAVTQDIYSGYSIPTQGWIFPAHTSTMSS